MVLSSWMPFEATDTLSPYPRYMYAIFTYTNGQVFNVNVGKYIPYIEPLGISYVINVHGNFWIFHTQGPLDGTTT